MKVEIVCVGTELLLGDIINTNAPYLAKECADLGLDCYYQTVIGDNHDRLLNQVKQSINRSDIVIFTGGLGPTYDDITKETVAEALGETLVFDEKAYELIETYFNKRGRQIAASNRKQAYTFKNSHTIYNDVGTAPAHVVKREKITVVLLPGPPYEMKYNFEHKVKPILRADVDETIVSKSLYLINIGESDLETLIYDQMKSMVNPTIAPYAMDDGVKLRVTAKAKTKKEAYQMIEPVVASLTQQLHAYIYSIDEEKIENVVANRLNTHGCIIGMIDNITDGSVITRLKDGKCIFSASLINKDTSIYTSEEDVNAANIRFKEDYMNNHECDVLVMLSHCSINNANIAVSVSYKEHHMIQYLSINVREKQGRDIFRKRVGSQSFKVLLDFLNQFLEL